MKKIHWCKTVEAFHHDIGVIESKGSSASRQSTGTQTVWLLNAPFFAILLLRNYYQFYFSYLPYYFSLQAVLIQQPFTFPSAGQACRTSGGGSGAPTPDEPGPDPAAGRPRPPALRPGPRPTPPAHGRCQRPPARRQWSGPARRRARWARPGAAGEGGGGSAALGRVRHRATGGGGAGWRSACRAPSAVTALRMGWAACRGRSRTVPRDARRGRDPRGPRVGGRWLRQERTKRLRERRSGRMGLQPLLPCWLQENSRLLPLRPRAESKGWEKHGARGQAVGAGCDDGDPWFVCAESTTA